MADDYNIVDGMNKSHNDSSAYDILAEDLKKCEDTILKIINSFNVCAKQDSKKNDADNVNVCDKQDTNNDDDDNSSDIDIDKLYNLSDKVLDNLNIVAKIKEEFLTNIEKIVVLLDKVATIPKNDVGLKFDVYKELNILADYLINHIWIMIYGKKRVNNETNNIDADKKDSNMYVRKYLNIVNDKISLINDILELINDLMGGINVNTSNDIALEKLKHFKSQLRTSGLDKLHSDSQLKATELIKLDTILNDSINVIWHEIYDRDKKRYKKD